MASTVYVDHPSSLRHDTGAHPERIERIVAIERAMTAADWLGTRRVNAPVVAGKTLLAVHSEAHVRAIEALSARGGGNVDMDTLASEGSYDAALHAAGGAAHMVDLLLSREPGSPRFGFCGLRPPGHHAEAARAMGFCLFNNVAVAARHARDAHRCERVLVLDWDVHHGNGTNDIFHADPGVLFVSIHQSPLYPGSGPASDAGRGDGLGFTVNLPVPPGSGDEVFCSLVEHLVALLARSYEPRLVLVSAGYDAHRDDPLAECRVSDRGYGAMTASVRRAAEALDVPVGIVLEGGYDLGALGRSVVETVGALTVPSAAPADGDLPLHPLTAAAATRAAAHWPALRGVAGRA